LIDSGQMMEDPLVYFFIYSYFFRPAIVAFSNVCLHVLYKLITKENWETVLYTTVATSILSVIFTYFYIKIEVFTLNGRFWP
jgi:hypothetical protein